MPGHARRAARPQPGHGRPQRVSHHLLPAQCHVPGGRGHHLRRSIQLPGGDQLLSKLLIGAGNHNPLVVGNAQLLFRASHTIGYNTTNLS